MDFELSDDQRALQEAARDVLTDLARARDGFGSELWKAMVDQGWLGVEVPEDVGGLGLGAVETAVVLEELGRHVAPVPFAPVAQLAIVIAGDELYAVELDDERRPEAEPAMDITRPLGWLRLDASTTGTRLGGRDAVDALLERGAAFTSAEMLGAADRVLAMSVDYAKERHQFGRPIGSFQAVKHRCADMLVDVEGMRSAAYYAAWCIGAEHPDASIAASTAKVWCSDAAKRVMASGLQVHGGIGFTWEHDLHLYLKRSQLDQLRFGDASFHRDRLAALVRSRVEAGQSVV
ncbi:MAG TPA: acyl-CoA dehydrogenase [Acidimicrobiales bacterium]|nr:acyl-CoA dehydrogenase [Acidimicrobiales bacterium]